MVARAESVIFLAVLCTILNIAQSENSEVDNDSDDDESLREALLLIKLIRRAGVSDASREKQLFLKHAVISSPLSPDPPQPLHNESVYNNTIPSNLGTKLNEEKHRHESYRRVMDYEDMFGTHPDETSTPTTTEAIADVKTGTLINSPPTKNTEERQDTGETSKAAEVVTTVTTSTVKSSPPEKTNTEKRPQTTGVKKPSDVQNQTPRKVQKLSLVKEISQEKKGNSQENVQKLTQHDINLQKKADVEEEEEEEDFDSVQKKIKVKKTVVNTAEKDPVVSQVESELKNELDTVRLPKKRPDFMSTFRISKGDRAVKVPTTLRVHLEGSSRYPIPFPENHALCYTDPNNGLCRTPI